MVNFFEKHFGRGLDHRIEHFHIDLFKSGNTAEERSLVFIELTEPCSSQTWKPSLVLTCGQGGAAGARHSSRACLTCGEIVLWEVIPFLRLLPWLPGPFCSLRIPNVIPEGPLWSREDLVSMDSREAGTRVRILQ